jgi:hypothetical protein
MDRSDEFRNMAEECLALAQKKTVFEAAGIRFSHKEPQANEG